ncbi:ABC transporter ATP-binding protein [Oceanotoga sp. DSM 15011]|jgi:lipoprotein-releasing system ATP-binding protein|uniref:ABC transporter ATP-binding protein n=1 Tax=Oceanotoga TaxID=1255275 RepID=UPI0021F41687|nr:MULTISPECIES: ABC transporter ATP-binding protein [Oceanotoga]MDN5341493.1 lipoprotein-releasing system ATP-binding protein [Oceanotoga sp.]MDO7977661.1 ABC transporter ATP-binding protein [Oceanotoga teriensis]UYP00524.1 ABC transporter ATP-binding protein [Oceanotoga sp. DSM 15011]
MDNVIILSKINKEYGSKIKTKVLYDIDLEIEEKSFNSIVGQSGSGKSTLLNIMGTLDNPTSGDVIINGNNVKDFGKKDLSILRNRNIGFIFQFHYLINEFTVLENILIPYRMYNRKIDDKIINKAYELMDYVGIYKYKNNYANQISGGQQQRTAIARSLINSPEIVLADEPTGNLDSVTTEEVYKLFRTIYNDFGTSFVIITHDKKVAERTDRIIEITDGKISSDIKII